MSSTTGFADFVVGNETFQTWYKILGDLKSGIRPCVIIHGGPGIPHHVLLNHDQLFKARSIPLVWYDALGCGASTHLPHKGKEFWTPELFMDELENLLKHLDIADDFDALGHSWGGMIATQWAATRHPKGLRRIVATDTPASVALWDKSGASLMLQLPKELQDTIHKHVEAGTISDPEYKAAIQEYYSRFICRCKPWPQEIITAFELLEKDNTVYSIMAGPNETLTIGTIKDWNIIDIIHTITQPVLLINGRHDMAQDMAVSPFFEKIPKVKWVTLAQSSHMPFWEEPEYYYKIVSDFLTAE